jgi:hypothetical protein
MVAQSRIGDEDEVAPRVFLISAAALVPEQAASLPANFRQEPISPAAVDPVHVSSAPETTVGDPLSKRLRC